MNRVLLLLIFGLMLGCSATKIDAHKILTMEQPPVEYNPPEPERWTINGIEIVFLENQELPLLDATLYLRHGSLHVPSIDSAVVSVTGGQMRAGGAGRWSSDELDLELEQLSAGIASAIGDEYGSVSVHGLVSDRNRLFEMFAAVVREPRFEEEQLSLWKGKSLESIRRRTEDPYTVASIAFQQLMYPDTPYGEVMVSETVKKINRLDLLKAHRALVRPDKAILTVTGAISRKEVSRLVEENFGDWEMAPYTFSEIPEVSTVPAPGVYLVEMPYEQSTFLMGQLGVKRLNPDYIPIIAFNEMFGAGGFSARLFQTVRVEMGLAYSAYGAIIPGISRGRNLITAQTKSESTVAAIAASLSELVKMQKNLVASAELEETQRALENSFVFKFASPGNLVSRYALLDLMQYPKDYDRTYLPNLKAITLEEVRTVAERYWDPRKFVVVLVGNKAACDSFETALQKTDFPLHELPVQRASFEEALVLKNRR